MEYILGIDAGATKTSAVVVDENGSVLGKGEAGPASLITSTEEDFKANVKKAVSLAVGSSGQDIEKFAAAGFGGAGIDTEYTYKKARERLADILLLEDNNKLAVSNDTQLILPACSGQDYGIAVIAGTGSNFYGKNKEGKEARAGGLDYLLSDEGSGYWVGLKILQAAVKSEDGRGEKTMLEETVKARFKVHSTQELMDIVYKDDFKKRDVADLAILGDKAYRAGDKVAERIFSDAAHEIALGINAVAKKLGMQEDEFDIVAVGGKFNSPYPFKEKIMEEVAAKKAKFIICKKELAEGAAKLARELLLFLQ